VRGIMWNGINMEKIWNKYGKNMEKIEKIWNKCGINVE
jgi:hypothetical protein